MLLSEDSVLQIFMYVQDLELGWMQFQSLDYLTSEH